MEKTLDEEIDEMKVLARTLIPYTFPKVDFKYEQDIILLKQRTVTVDGFDILVCYSKSDYDDHFLESVQIQSAFAPFLPFTIVCKLGRAFLGVNKLSYIEFFRNNKKVYCWTLKSRDDRPLPPDKKNTPGRFEGYDYTILQPGSVDLF